MTGTLATELDILTAARDQIKKGYTSAAFVGVANGDVEHMSTRRSFESNLKKPGHYAVVCAVGGVEHALYSLCNRFITDSVREKWMEVGGLDEEYQAKYDGGKREADVAKIKDETIALYAKCLVRLNKIAVKMGYKDVEHPNTELDEEESKPIVLAIYRKAIRQARDEQRRNLDAELDNLLSNITPGKKVAVPA